LRIIYDKSTGCGTGVGFVSFRDKASLFNALNLNESDFLGRKIRVSKILGNREASTGEYGKHLKGQRRKQRKRDIIATKFSEFSTLNDTGKIRPKQFFGRVNKKKTKTIKKKLKKSLMAS